MIPKIFSTALVAVTCVLPWAAHAAPLSFDELVKKSLLASPEAAQIDATLAERAAEAFNVKVKQNPVLDLSVDVPTEKPPGGGIEQENVSLSLSQSLRPSDFGERTALADLINETAGIDKTLALNEFVMNMSLLYARAWQFQEMDGLIGEGRNRAQHVLKKVSHGASKGLFPEGDVELFKAELKSFEAQGLATRADLARAKAELTRLSGIVLSDRQLVKPPSALPVERTQLIQLVQESKLPVQQRYELLRRTSQKQLEVARLDSHPTFTPSLGLGRHDDGTDQVMVGVSVSLPFFNRNQGEEMRARGALAAAERSRNYANSERMVSEALLLFDALVSTREQVTVFDTGVIPAKRRAVDAYQRQFEIGASTTFQLWQAQRELNESRLRSIELQSGLAAIRSQINSLIGQVQF